MYIFSKKYEKSINFDLLRKKNIVNFENVCSKKGDGLILSFSTTENQQKTKLKNLLILESLTLRKAFFKFDKISNKSKRKRSFHVVQTRSCVYSNSNYFLYNFNKNSIGLTKNLQEFKQDFDPVCFDFLVKSFNEFKILKINFLVSLNVQKLAFYRIFL